MSRRSYWIEVRVARVSYVAVTAPDDRAAHKLARELRRLHQRAGEEILGVRVLVGGQVKRPGSPVSIDASATFLPSFQAPEDEAYTLPDGDLEQVGFIRCDQCGEMVRGPALLKEEGIDGPFSPAALEDHRIDCSWVERNR